MAAETIAIANESGQQLWQSGALGVLGWAQAREGDPDEGIQHILAGVEMARGVGAQLGVAQMLPLLADAYHRAEKVPAGLAAVDEALAIGDRTGYAMVEPEVHRLKGELLLMQGDGHAEAEACFHRQQTRSWELRATMSLCRLWQATGKATEARRLLQPLYAWFTEGFDTPYLQDARALLVELP